MKYLAYTMVGFMFLIKAAICFVLFLFLINNFSNTNSQIPLIYENKKSRLQKEPYYLRQWCDKKKGIKIYMRSLHRRSVCQTRKLYVEFAYADLWETTIGEALSGALDTKTEAAIVLIMEKEFDRIYLDRLKYFVKYYKLPIRVFNIKNF